jgi:hypothetical protein
MSKKIIAIAIALLMVFSVFSVIQPAKAVTPSDVSVFLRPGVEDPYHPGWSQTLGTLRTNPEVVEATYLNYAILASTETSPSIGDLQFDITFAGDWTGALYIWIPPDFVFLKPDGTETTDSADMRFNVWTDITNDYSYISVSQRSAWDSYAAFWTRIRIGFPGFQPDDDAAWYDGVTIQAGTYHVRVFNLKAPTIAGVYHFKMRLYGPGGDYFSPNDFPIMIVKSELNPGYIVGQVGLCANGSPCTVTDTTKYGKVWAEGTTAEGRTVTAAYYFGPEDASDGMYTYWLFGLAPGTYTIYASAGGYPKVTGERVEITAGQSMHLKAMWLLGGPVVTITVWSKHGRGAIPWGSLWQPPYGTNDPSVVDLDKPRPISFDLYDGDGNHLVWGCSASLLCGPYLFTDPEATSFTTSMGPDIGFTAMAPTMGGANVDGFTGGVNYKVESWVTGYVMTELDAWQRTFTVPGTVSVEMDLRRSNYFTIELHEIPLPSVPTSLVLTAEQDGVEKGAASLLVDSNGDLLFWDTGAPALSYGPHLNPATGVNYNIANFDKIILEGWSYRYLADQYQDDLAWRDYGFEPGTYDIQMYMADMGDTTGMWWGTPGVIGQGWYTIREGDAHTGSIALCNSPSLISFRVRTNSLWIKIRSLDWQSPSHPRPWLFPGAEIGVDILDMDGNVVEIIDNSVWGIVQDDGSIGSFYAGYDMTSGDFNLPDPGTGYILTIPFTGNDFGVSWAYGPNLALLPNSAPYPTHIAAGQYTYAVHTYGYVERRTFPNQLALGGKADIQVDLIQGGQIRVFMNFYKQHALLAPVQDFDGFVRVEVFNDANELVGASIYGMADVNPLAPGAYLPYDSQYDFKKLCSVDGVCEPAEGAGSDTWGGYGQRAYTSHFFWGEPLNTFADYYNLNYVDSHRLVVTPDGTPASDVFGFYWYFGGQSSRNDGLWANGFDTTSGTLQPDTGLRGTSDGPGIDGGGSYKVKVWAFEPGEGKWNSYYMVSDPTGIDVPWGGAVSVYVDLEQMGRLSGSISWINMYGDMEAMPWLQLTASSSQGTVVAYSTPMGFDPATSFLTDEPAYFMWLPGPSDTKYTVTAQATVAPQILAISGAEPEVSISPGFESTADVGMLPTGTPIPEFPLAPLVALSALAASLFVLRRRRK